jgi:hypothetical protein
LAVSDETRIGYRRELHRLKNELAMMQSKLAPYDPVAAAAMREARNAVFLAWTILALPSRDDDD